MKKKRAYTYQEFRINLANQAEALGKTIPVIGETKDTLLIKIDSDSGLRVSPIVTPARIK